VACYALRGDLYTFHEDYKPEHRLGNLNVQTLDEIFFSEAYERSLLRDEATIERFCRGCEYNQACDAGPLFATDQAGDFEGRCPVAYPMYRFLENWTESMGFAQSELIAAARGIASSAG
jgi:radical SAM protein with 4Fe4S-binding SPASM domain